MKITFLQDYRGVLTGERFFEKNATVDTGAKGNEVIDGEALVKAGRAKKVGGATNQTKKD